MLTSGPDGEAWLSGFDISAYQPMICLAAGSDRNRKRQRSLLRGYLRHLSADFNRLHAIATAQRPSASLCEHQMAFIFHMWTVEARLLLHAVIPHAINLNPLLAKVEALAHEVRELTQPRMHYQASA